MEPEAVGRESPHRRESRVTVKPPVLQGEFALPEICPVRAPGSQFVSPGIACVPEPSAGSVFELGLGGQPGASPGAIGNGIVPGQVHDGKVLHALVRGVRAVRAAPVGAIALRPPAEFGIEHAGPSQPFGFGDVAGCADKPGEPGVGDLVGVDMKGIHENPVGRTLVRQPLVRAHGEFPSRDQQHFPGIGPLTGIATRTEYGPDCPCRRRHLALLSCHGKRAARSFFRADVAGLPENRKGLARYLRVIAGTGKNMDLLKARHCKDRGRAGETGAPAIRSMRTALLIALSLLVAAPALAQAQPALSGADDARERNANRAPLEEIVVTARRRPTATRNIARSLTALGSEHSGWNLGQTHVQEVLARAPGVNLQRGSGQEYLPALRSPVLTGAGACGALLAAEDGIPLTSPGFCNVNELFFAHHEAASRVEILRGPGAAVHGGNALHGVVNIITAIAEPSSMAGVELGAQGLRRLRLVLPGESNSGLRLTGTRAGGFRNGASYRQLKFNGFRAGGRASWKWTAAVAASGLDQDTAGYVTGLNSYRDREAASSNPDPEAFRRAVNLRAYLRLEYSRGEALTLVVTPYARYSRMRFRMHFLPGDPFESNRHGGAGMQSAVHVATAAGALVAGLDVEYTKGELKQWQEGEAAGSALVREVFPPGEHYDYRAGALWMAPFAQFDLRLGERWTVSAGARYERVRYDYRTRLPAGRARDDSSVCGFGGCRYSRPADRTDRFGTFSPKLSLMWRPAPRQRLWLSLAHGFRMPQATELYRLQGAQAMAELRPENMRAAEMGVALRAGKLAAQLVVYRMRKRDVLFRDAELFNRAGGGTRHEGLEAELGWPLGSALTLELNASFARHRYDRGFLPAGINLEGLDVDTAPRRFGGARLRWRDGEGPTVELECLWTGGYYLEPQNLHRYPGHELFNVRVRAALGARLTAYLRVLNLTNRAYANRADYTAFGGERYFPGAPRSLYLGLGWRW